MKAARWENSAQLKAAFGKASVIDRERVVFDICGGNYRLVVAISYAHQIAFVKFLGSHKEYDKIDAATVSEF